jgi:hypothetical protein
MGFCGARLSVNKGGLWSKLRSGRQYKLFKSTPYKSKQPIKPVAFFWENLDVTADVSRFSKFNLSSKSHKSGSSRQDLILVFLGQSGSGS